MNQLRGLEKDISGSKKRAAQRKASTMHRQPPSAVFHLMLWSCAADTVQVAVTGRFAHICRQSATTLTKVLLRVYRPTMHFLSSNKFLSGGFILWLLS